MSGLTPDEREGVRRAAWDTLKRFADDPRSDDRTKAWSLSGSTVGHALRKQTADAAIASGVNLDLQRLMSRPISSEAPRELDANATIREVFLDALHQGFVRLGMSRDEYWPASARQGEFQFTERGLAQFRRLGPSPSRGGSVRAAVQAMANSGVNVAAGTLDLLDEAQSCWRSMHNRAAVVLIGLASESNCIGFLDALRAHWSAPAPGSPLVAAWNNLDPSKAFQLRWSAAGDLLDSLARQPRSYYRGTPYFTAWQAYPRALQAVVDAVRVSRNAGAHHAAGSFSGAETALLLASMPHILRSLAELTESLDPSVAAVPLPQL